MGRYRPQGSTEVKIKGTDTVVYMHGDIYAIGYRGKSNKPVFNYRFVSKAARDRHVQIWIQEEIEDMKRKEDRAKTKKEALKNLEHPFQVGVIVYDSWGYEQTNIDWYQVVECKGRSVVLREIAGNYEETGFMSGHTSPVKDAFLENHEPVKKLVQVYIDNEGKPVSYLKSKYGWISVWDGKQRVYESHYA